MKNFKKFLLLIFITLLLVPAINITKVSAATNDVVNIEDLNLNAAILEALGKDSDYKLTEGDLATLTVLHANNRNIETLEGLQYCTNLEILDVAGNPLTNLKGIGNLQKLEAIFVYDDNLTSFNDLVNCPNLYFISAARNNIHDISALAKLPSLYSVHIGDNFVEDLSPLKHVKKLKHLYVYHNLVSDISDLKNSTNLEELDVRQNFIADISPLANLNKLKLAYAYDQRVTLDDIKLKPGKEFSFKNPLIDLDGSTITSINNFSHNGYYDSKNNKVIWNGLKETTVVSYGFNKMINVSGLDIEFSGRVEMRAVIPNSINIPDKGLKAAIKKALNTTSDYIIEDDLLSLTYLDAMDRDINTLEGLEYCTNVKTLLLSGNHIKDISKLSHLTKLEVLTIYDNRITNFNDLKNCKSLRSISAARNDINDLSALAELTNLQYLYVPSNKFTDVTPLKDLVNLIELTIDYNDIGDISILNKLNKLEKLNITHIGVHDLSVLTNYPELKILLAGKNYAKDLPSIVNNPTKLQYVQIDPIY